MNAKYRLYSFKKKALSNNKFLTHFLAIDLANFLIGLREGVNWSPDKEILKAQQKAPDIRVSQLTIFLELEAESPTKRCLLVYRKA